MKMLYRPFYNDARVDLVLIQPLLLSYVNENNIVLMLTSIFQA